MVVEKVYSFCWIDEVGVIIFKFFGEFVEIVEEGEDFYNVFFDWNIENWGDV